MKHFSGRGHSFAFNLETLMASLIESAAERLGYVLVWRSQPLPLNRYARGRVWWIAIVCLVLSATGSPVEVKCI